MCYFIINSMLRKNIRKFIIFLLDTFIIFVAIHFLRVNQPKFPLCAAVYVVIVVVSEGCVQNRQTTATSTWLACQSANKWSNVEALAKLFICGPLFLPTHPIKGVSRGVAKGSGQDVWINGCLHAWGKLFMGHSPFLPLFWLIARAGSSTLDIGQ